MPHPAACFAVLGLVAPKEEAALAVAVGAPLRQALARKEQGRQSAEAVASDVGAAVSVTVDSGATVFVTATAFSAVFSSARVGPVSMTRSGGHTATATGM